MDNTPIRLSVRQLVEFILSHGDIDSRFSGEDRALLGARIHRRLQRECGKNYTAEVQLKKEVTCCGISYLIEGRADGIILEEDTVVIDEIKTTAAPLETIDENFNPLHWEQAICYGYLYCAEKGLSSITLQLRYYHIEYGSLKTFRRKMEAEDLEKHLFSLLESYEKWARIQLDWPKTRNASLKGLTFPFSAYRKGQRTMAVAVYKTIADKKKLFCQAPTGIGKTISSLFPALKAMGEEKCGRIFYLTAKTITRQAAENALALLRSENLRLKSITLTAKDKICLLSERNCIPENCPYARGHYDRVNDALYELLQKRDDYTREILEETAEKHTVCPFELALDLSLWCDAVICDYNYAFDPQVSLRRFFSAAKNDSVLLIDEAHNLINRSREMFSAVLQKSKLLGLKSALPKEEKKLRKALNQSNACMIELRKTCEEGGYIKSHSMPEALNESLYQLCTLFEEYVKEHAASLPEEFLPAYFDILSYLRTAELYGENYMTYIYQRQEDVIVRLLCLDPSSLLKSVTDKCLSTIFFSATLSPIDYYISVLDGGQENKKLLLPSPFDRENLFLAAAGHISTRYKDRDKSIQPLTDILYHAVSQKSGNYMAFFPSYQYMSQVYAAFTENYPRIKTLLQEKNTSEEDREGFLSSFCDEPSETLLGFCVLGGIYSEGIDLKGKRLSGAVIVGTGIPQIHPEQDILREYYEEYNHMGYEYAYTYPGMNKVLQAAGRVIRSETDKGFILLIDDRFLSGAYQALYPAHWQGMKRFFQNKALSEDLKKFWKM